MQPSPKGAAATFFQYSRPVSIAYFLQPAGKLSFGQLDKRLSDLESQMKEIQEWKKQVESRLQI